jgi:hypothetical protein
MGGGGVLGIPPSVTRAKANVRVRVRVRGGVTVLVPVFVTVFLGTSGCK